MTNYALHTSLLIGFVFLFYAALQRAMLKGKPSLPTPLLYLILALGLMGMGHNFIESMEVVGWSEGLVAFITLAGAMANLHLIRRRCPSCHMRLNLEEQVANPPSRHAPGMGVVLWACAECGHYRVETHTIPRLAETASEAKPWEPSDPSPLGAFGASYGSGSSGSLSWKETSTPGPTQSE